MVVAALVVVSVVVVLSKDRSLAFLVLVRHPLRATALGVARLSQYHLRDRCHVQRADRRHRFFPLHGHDGTWKMRNDDGPLIHGVSHCCRCCYTVGSHLFEAGLCVATTGAFGEEDEDEDGKCTSASASAYKEHGALYLLR